MIITTKHRFGEFLKLFEQRGTQQFTGLIPTNPTFKHLMTHPMGNSEFCFPGTLIVPQGKAEGT